MGETTIWHNLLAFGIGLVVITVALAYGADITESIGQNNFCSSGFTYNVSAQTCDNATHHAVSPPTSAGNISAEGQGGLAEIAQRLDTVAVIAAVSVLLFMLFRLGAFAGAE